MHNMHIWAGNWVIIFKNWNLMKQDYVHIYSSLFAFKKYFNRTKSAKMSDSDSYQ